MEILLDSNIIGRYFDRSDPDHPTTCYALQKLTAADHVLCYTPQVEAEFISFASRRREDNGFGLDSEALELRLDRLEQAFSLKYPDCASERQNLRTLRRYLGVTGRMIHDLRLLAACLLY